MSIDLTSLTIPELTKVITDAQSLIEQLKKKTVLELRRKILDMAREAGFTISDLFPQVTEGTSKAAAGSPLGKSVAAKYANPADPNQTWSGRGKHPHWVRDAITAGKTLKDLAI